MNQTVNIDVQVQTKSINDLEKELSQVNEELKGLEIGSQKFKELSKDSQALTKQLDKANKAAEGFTDDKKFLAADGAIKTMAGSLSGVVGTLGLIGVESETFGEMEKKAASAIAVAMGVKDVSEGIKQMADANVLAAAKAKIMGITTKQALIATGIGAFVVLLGTMIAYWDDIVKGVRKFGESVPFVGKAIEALENAINSVIDAFRPVLEWLGILPDEAERAAQAVKVANETIVTEGGRELAMLQARGAKAEEIFKKKQEILEAELANLKAANEDQQAIYDKETELMVLKETEKTRIHNEETQKRLDREKQANEEFLQELNERYEAEALLEQELNDAFLAMMADRKEKEDEFNIDDILYLEEDPEDDAELQKSLEINKRLVEIEKDKQEKLKESRAQGLANVIAIAGAEGDIGKAAFIAQQIMNAKAAFEEAKKTLTFSTQVAARSTMAVAEGTAQTAKIGFPQNIPMLLGYAAQAAGIISSIKSALKASKGSYQVGTVPTTVVNQAPTQTQIQPDQIQQLTAASDRTVRAYVVGGDVRSNNEADAKIQNRRTID